MDRISGIILSLSIITALGIAVLDNPQVQTWLEEQRKKIAELLQQIGQELDPQSRRQAEAFAFEGRTVANDEKLAREAEGSRDAAALATGRTLSNASTVRRIPVQGPVDPNEAEERRRKGREYLAKRNQQLYELQQKRKATAKAEGMETPPTPTFDELVDAEGKLKDSAELNEKELPEPPTLDPLPEPVIGQMKEVERQLAQPIPVAASGSIGSSGWSWGSQLANPFTDEYAIDRSITPKPPVPPKIRLDPVPVPERAPTPPISVPGSFSPPPTEPQRAQYQTEGLSYDEQLAIALSLSEQESSKSAATVRQEQSAEENDLMTAIAASLKEMDDQQASHAIANTRPATPGAVSPDSQPLVDLTPSTPRTAPVRPHTSWAELWTQLSLSEEPLSLAAHSSGSDASDELYRLTPELTKARLASLESQTPQPMAASSSRSSLPFDPVRDAVAISSPPVPDVMDASFYSAHDQPSPAPSPITFDRDTPQLVDVSDDTPHEGQRTPISRAHSSFGFQTDSDTETWASASATASRTASRAHSRAQSEISDVEVIDLVEDSDVDMLSEEGDGVATPDSWSEVGSRDGDSESEQQDLRQPHLA